MKIKKLTLLAFIITIIGFFMIIIGIRSMNFNSFTNIGKEFKKSSKNFQLNEYFNQKFNANIIDEIDINADYLTINLYNTDIDNFSVKVETNIDTILPEIKLDGNVLKIDREIKKTSKNDDEETIITIQGPFNKLSGCNISSAVILLNLDGINSENVKMDLDLDMSKANLNNLYLKNIKCEASMSYIIINKSNFENFDTDLTMSKLDTEDIKITNSNMEFNMSQIHILNSIFEGKNNIDANMSDIYIGLNKNNDIEIFKNGKESDTKNYISIKDNMCNTRIKK